MRFFVLVELIHSHLVKNRLDLFVLQYKVPIVSIEPVLLEIVIVFWLFIHRYRSLSVLFKI